MSKYARPRKSKTKRRAADILPSRKNQPKHTLGIPWERTSMVIINGSNEGYDKDNAKTAARAAIEHEAAAVYSAGKIGLGTKAVKRYGTADARIDAMLKAVGKNTKEGDTVFLQIWAHGLPDTFGVGKEPLKYEKLMGMLEKHLEGRNIIFVSDACYSANFVNRIMESEKFNHVVAMSPGEVDEATAYKFTNAFVHALRYGVDLDGNKVPTVMEGFYYAMKKYRQVKPGTLGTYRESITRIESLDEVENGVVMVRNVDSPCEEMDSMFNTANLLMVGRGKFYLMDSHEWDGHADPVVVLIKNGREVVQDEGVMDLQEFRGWMQDNGLKVPKFNFSPKGLYRKGRYETMLLVATYPEIEKVLGNQEKALSFIASHMKHSDPGVRKVAVELFKEGIKQKYGKKYGADIRIVTPQELDGIKRIIALLSDGNSDVQREAAWAMTGISHSFKVGTIPGAVPALIKLLNSENETTISAVGIALMGAELHENVIKKQQMMRRIGRLIVNPDPSVRVAAVELLGKSARKIDLSKYPKLVKGLVKALDDPDPMVNRAAIEAWREIGRSEKMSDYSGAIKELSGLLTHPIGVVKKAAIESLSNLEDKGLHKHPQLIESLVKNTYDWNPGVKTASASLLSRIAIYGDLSLHPGAVERIVDLLYDDDPHVRALGIVALGVTIEKTGLDKIPGALESLLDKMYDEAPWVRYAAVEVLGNLTPMVDLNEYLGATERVVELLYDNNQDVRSAAARTIGIIIEAGADFGEYDQVIDALVMMSAESRRERWGIRTLGKVGRKVDLSEYPEALGLLMGLFVRYGEEPIHAKWTDIRPLRLMRALTAVSEKTDLSKYPELRKPLMKMTTDPSYVESVHEEAKELLKKVGWGR